MNEAFWDTLPIERFKLTKKKVTKKRKTDVVPGKFEIPTLITTDPKMTKDAFDTNKFTDLIIAYLKSVHGCNSARRISSEGRYREGVGWLKGLNKGMEDIQCVLNGRMFAIEVKSPTDKMGEAQLKRKAAVEKDGGVYIIAEGFEQVQEEIINCLMSAK
jgi:hypothetical protein